jgi:sn-glycerol 3-phosphate transport system permease protein
VSRVTQPSKVSATIIYVWLVIAAIVLLFPILLTVVGGFLPSSDLLQQPPNLLGHFTLESYLSALKQTTVPLAPAFANSLFVGITMMVAQVVTSALAAYSLVFLRNPIGKWLFWLFMATIMVPYEAIVVPNALFVRSLGIGDNRLSLVLPFLAVGFGVFLMRQAFKQFPNELRQAAEIDGCGHMRFLFTILLPATRPSLTALAVWSFLQGWNMYFWPLIIASGDNSLNTLQTAVFALKSNEFGDPGILLAGITITLIPTLLLVIFGQRWLIRGFTAGAVK